MLLYRWDWLFEHGTGQHYTLDWVIVPKSMCFLWDWVIQYTGIGCYCTWDCVFSVRVLLYLGVGVFCGIRYYCTQEWVLLYLGLGDTIPWDWMLPTVTVPGTGCFLRVRCVLCLYHALLEASFRRVADRDRRTTR